ncbi:UvrD-helicase domain-containing protein [Mongoliitalea daihaiensis]|uniref:UvrD-helicase domain-containing protein n=1 Tax=Mongoliitalea daihaiensis TaxID=2782006 RepID=UPI001F18153B|nr:UvrD-helicase domain-containing protein [Mongoliitalea daihaiensis]UJP63343.1 UvrD-helicase domain-containing protein [Mongoliitalea daihaiensis]
MEQAPFIIYKSSAGSGKTYTLTLEYLKIALAYPGAFKSILAVTFTNKATQEMKSRILEYLERLSREVKPEEFLDKELMKHLNMNAPALQKRAHDTLLDILHAYGYFSVSTIDAFFQRVIRSFAKEMDLQAKFDLELDQEAVLERLVDRLMEKVSLDQALKKWLVEYATEQIQNGGSWDIRGGIQTLGREIFTEGFKAHRHTFQQAMDQEDFIKQLKAELMQQRALLIKKALEWKQKANDIRVQFGLEWGEFSGGNSGQNFARKLDHLGDKKNPFSSFNDNQLAKAQSVDGWYAKTSKRKDAIESAANAGLRDLIFDCHSNRVQWETYATLIKQLNVFGIFRDLILELRDLKDEESILLISDVNDFLKEITKDNEAPFVYEKIGNQYKHFLIDEFQDTSDFQWASFRPLLENSLASGHTNLLVGDVKQSIYRWRGGKLELLLEEVEQQISSQLIEVKNLDVNYRSLPKVIDFNNSVFEQLPSLLEVYMLENTKTAADHLLQKAYEDVKQQVPHKKRELPFQGMIQIQFHEKAARSSFGNEEEEAEEENDVNVLAKLPQLLMDLQDKGYQLKDIAFLVRKKSEGAAIADYLMEYAQQQVDAPYRFDVLSEESLFIDKSIAVKAMVALLTYLRNAEDTVALKTAFYYYALLKEVPFSHELFEKFSLPVDLQAKYKELQVLRGKWLQYPLLELIEHVIQFLDLTTAGNDLAYIAGFKEAVFDYVKKNRADLNGLLDWWELNKTKRTVKIPEDHDAMRILTIHKSKGLQFKIVIMPYLNWTILPPYSLAPILWATYEHKGIPTIAPIKQEKSLMDTLFAELYTQEVKLAYMDTLNMLYVAFTRAEDMLWGFAEYSSNKDGIVQTKSTGGVLKNLLEHMGKHGAAEEMDWDAEQECFVWGSMEGISHRSEIKTIQPPLVRWEFRDWNELLNPKEYAWDFSPQGVDDRSQRRIGVLVHEILEHSNRLEDALGLVQSYAFEGRFTSEVQQEVEQQLRELFALPQLQAWFGEGYQSLAEQGILIPQGGQKRPDRIFISAEEALVVDFKTGAQKTQHLEQVSSYMSLVASIVQKPVKGYVCYLEPTELIEVL